MAVKLVVSDVDGTLVDKQKQLTPATVAAVARLREAGVPFAAISARPISGMLPLLAPLGLDREVAAFNGGIVFKADGTIVSHATIAPDAARGVVALAAGRGVNTWAFADDTWFASDANGPHTRSERISSNQEPIVRAGFDELLDRADKVTFVSDDAATLRALYEEAHATFGGVATIAQSQAYYLDVTAFAANKGAGLLALAAAYGVRPDEVVAIGDQNNDLPMLARAGYGIAMGNAPANVQGAADAVTRANDADGVAHAIDTIILPAISKGDMPQ